jgi:NAD(P)-dependent dehydrogenase (short-subunit alcohol dehydrogenase family)
MAQTDPQVVLITGASAGIGRAGALHLAQRGFTVFGASRRPPAQPGPVTFIEMDVNETASVQRGVQEVLRQAGRIDVAVNNAGFGFGGPIEETSVPEVQAQFETNFFGTLRVCQAVLPAMRARRSGLIVNISSLGGLMGLPYQGPYSASKYAIEGLSEALRMEVRPFGVRVVLVEPADFRTDFTARRQRCGGAGEGSPYAASFERAMAVIEHDETSGSPPESMGRLLERIIASRRPRLRYRAGSFTEQLAAILKPYLPQPLFEWILRQHYHL